MRKHIKNYFIPHAGNDYAPHSLQKAAMVAMVAMVFVSFTVATMQSLLWVASDWLVGAVLPGVIVDLTNEERDSGALGTLRRNATLDAAAKLKAEDMAQKSYFAHYSPAGTSPWYWFGQVGYNFVHAGENLAVHFTDSGEVVSAWMNSPSHRANIMDGKFTEIGVGTAEGAYEGYPTVFVVQLFGTPALATTAVAGEATTAPVLSEPTASPTTSPALAAPVAEDTVLADRVTLTETVAFIEAEPELVLIEEVVAVSSTSEVIVATEKAEETPRTSQYLELIATSTGGVPASIHPQSTPYTTESNWLGRAATQPHQLLQGVYAALGVFVVMALVLSVVIEIRRQHPIQIAYAALLLLLMFGLYEVHMAVTAGALVV